VQNSGESLAFTTQPRRRLGEYIEFHSIQCQRFYIPQNIEIEAIYSLYLTCTCNASKKNLPKSLHHHHNYLQLPRTVAVARMGLLPSLLILLPVLPVEVLPILPVEVLLVEVLPPLPVEVLVIPNRPKSPCPRQLVLHRLHLQSFLPSVSRLPNLYAFDGVFRCTLASNLKPGCGKGSTSCPGGCETT
jgi:hypothetical protein